LEQARAEAEMILAGDAGLSRPEHAGLRAQVDRLWSRASDMS